MIRHAIYLAWRHLVASPWRTAILVICTSVALFLPLFTMRTASLLEGALLARATSSPILVGSRGDPFDLTLAALYFRGSVADTLPLGAAERLRPYGRALPLHVGHTASGTPVVGTDASYLDARQLQVSEGRRFALLGEVVAGANAAHAFGLKPGGKLRTDLTNLYNLAGAYPFVLEVVGVLAPTGTADDDAFFVDLRTSWMLDGAVHGHVEVTDDQAIGSDEAGNLEASAAIFLAQEVNDDTRASFHLHGDPSELPVTGFLVYPSDTRRHDQLLGELALDDSLAAVRPVDIVRTIFGIVLRLQDGLNVAFALVAAATVGFFGLTMALTLRLRSAELMLLRRLGSSRYAVAWIVGTEIAFLSLTAACIGGLAAWLGAAQVALALH